MSAAAMPAGALERHLARPAGSAVFDPAELDGLPDPVRRYLRTAIGPGTPLATAAALRMRGTIRLGRWLPFRATELLAPQRGFRWSARVAGVVSGSDSYAAGQGRMDWRLLGVFPVMRADGPDVARSAAGRAAAEACWVPTALLPRFGTRWSAVDERHVRARTTIDGTSCDVDYTLDEQARPTRIVLDRWGDPDGTGAWGWHPFGFEVTTHATFGGLTVPGAGRAGWFAGTDRQERGEFFRVTLTALRPVT
ncbi:DUF6544 family protein [Micromonospora chersina]|uniref:DUF6544 family protein n=1 Tax=Micromonospora chersina TaxID=47854 RepID=UPI0037AA4591